MASLAPIERGGRRWCDVEFVYRGFGRDSIVVIVPVGTCGWTD